MPEVSEITGVFDTQPEKKMLLKKAHSDIVKNIIRAEKFPTDEIQGRKLGWSFESLVVEELLETQQPNERQKVIREIIKSMFENTDVSIGKDKASKPDFVNVILDKYGQPIIDEIVEVKLSEEALGFKISHQPQNTIRTIEAIVTLINEMRVVENFEDLEVIKSLKKTEKYRYQELKKYYDRVKKIKLEQDITFSEKLSYHIIISSDERATLPNLDLKIGTSERRVSAWISQSRYSIGDIKIIVKKVEQKLINSKMDHISEATSK